MTDTVGSNHMRAGFVIVAFIVVSLSLSLRSPVVARADGNGSSDAETNYVNSSIDREKEAKAVWFSPSIDLSKKIRAAQTLIPKGANPGDVLRILGKSSPWGQSDWDIFLLAYCTNANGAIVVVFNKITPGNDEDFTNFCFSCVSYATIFKGNTLIPPDTNGR